MRGVTNFDQESMGSAQFQSTLPMRGVTELGDEYSRLKAISIHTPHAGSDEKADVRLGTSELFQSTLPMRGVTTVQTAFGMDYVEFQSTLPMRGVTESDSDCDI